MIIVLSAIALFAFIIYSTQPSTSYKKAQEEIRRISSELGVKEEVVIKSTGDFEQGATTILRFTVKNTPVNEVNLLADRYEDKLLSIGYSPSEFQRPEQSISSILRAYSRQGYVHCDALWLQITRGDEELNVEITCR